MAAADSRRCSEELARLGDEAYNRRVRPTLRPEDENKFVAIDVVTGEFEIDPDDYSAVMRLHERIPEADIWLCRVGRPTAYIMRSGR